VWLRSPPATRDAAPEPTLAFDECPPGQSLVQRLVLRIDEEVAEVAPHDPDRSQRRNLLVGHGDRSYPTRSHLCEEPVVSPLEEIARFHCELRPGGTREARVGNNHVREQLGRARAAQLGEAAHGGSRVPVRLETDSSSGPTIHEDVWPILKGHPHVGPDAFRAPRVEADTPERTDEFEIRGGDVEVPRSERVPRGDPSCEDLTTHPKDFRTAEDLRGTFHRTLLLSDAGSAPGPRPGENDRAALFGRIVLGAQAWVPGVDELAQPVGGWASPAQDHHLRNDLEGVEARQAPLYQDRQLRVVDLQLSDQVPDGGRATWRARVTHTAGGPHIGRRQPEKAGDEKDRQDRAEDWADATGRGPRRIHDHADPEEDLAGLLQVVTDHFYRFFGAS